MAVAVLGCARLLSWESVICLRGCEAGAGSLALGGRSLRIHLPHHLRSLVLSLRESNHLRLLAHCGQFGNFSAKPWCFCAPCKLLQICAVSDQNLHA